MNQVCACGTLVATLCSDCCLPYELHLSAAHVRAVPALHAGAEEVRPGPAGQ
ncbi:hypothetical protein ACWGQT_23250 [Streptomyces yangpuensis]